MSVFSFGPAKPVTLVHCQYILATPKLSPNEQLTQKADDINGRVIKTEQLNMGSLLLDWVHIKKQDVNVDIFAGIVHDIEHDLLYCCWIGFD